MKVTCLSNVSDNLKSLVSLRLGLLPNTFIDKQTLVDLTELYCTENNIDTVDYENHIDDIADFIANRLNVNMDQDALGANLETGLLVSEDDYDAFYEQNQMLLNTEIEATPENLSMALSATEIHSFAKIINLENGNIYVSFPEATFGEVYVSPNKTFDFEHRSKPIDIRKIIQDAERDVYQHLSRSEHEQANGIISRANQLIHRLYPSLSIAHNTFELRNTPNLEALRRLANINEPLTQNEMTGLTQMLANKLGATFRFVPESKNLIKEDSENDNTVCYIEMNDGVFEIHFDKITLPTYAQLAEELLHPLTYTIQSKNPELFNSFLELVNKSKDKAIKAIADRVEKLYQDKTRQDIDNEKVTQALAFMMKESNIEKYNDNSPEGNVFRKILDWIVKLFNNSRIEEILPSNHITLENLAYILKFENVRFQVDNWINGMSFSNRSNIDANSISDRTEDFGVELNKGGAKTMQSDAKKWLQSNPDGIVAYRKYKDTPKTFTKDTVDEGWIGNPFSTESKGKDTVLKFYDWIVTGESFGESRANEEYRQAVISKILSTPEDAKVLYYTELDRPSHATVIGYLVRNKQLLQQLQPKTQSSKQISVSTEGYHKGDPQRNPDTAYVFTENAQAHLYSITGDLSDSVLGDTVTPKLNVSDVNGTNQAGIRTDKNGNLSENAFGIVVKKRLQDNSGKWLSKEGLFEDSEEDFDLFKTLNRHVFNDIEDSSLSKIVFPSQMALGKSALPKRFAEWLQKELKSRFGINSTMQKNTTSGYDGYGLQINSVEQQLQQRKPQQKQKTLDDYVKEFDDLAKFFGEKVVKDKDFKKNHTYWVIDENGNKHKAVSVTQYIKGESSSNGSENPSLSIGNSFDKFVRDYFDGKDVSKATYANIPTLKSKNPLRAKLIQLLDNFKAALDQRFGKGKYRVITKEFPIGGKVGNKYIAGTADMYVIDDKGNIYIFDMKTYSSERNFDKESKSTYPAQVSLYTQLIENNLPFGSTLSVSDQIGLIVARVKYPNEADTSYGDRSNFDSNNGIVSRNGKDIASYKFFDIDIEHNGSLIGGFVKGLQIQQFKDEVQGLSREERQDLMELLDETTIPPATNPTPEQPQPVMDKPSVVFEENNAVPNTDIVKISRSIVKQISMYCDMLTNDYQGDLAMNLLGPDFVQLDDAGLWENMPTSASDLLSRQGAYKVMFERLVQLNFPYGENEYNDWLNENVGYLINSSFGELKKLEGVHIDVTGSIIIDSQEDDDTQSLYDAVRDELEKEIDSYDIDKRTQSIKENMPLVLKRKIFNIPKYIYDDFGNAIRNVDGTMQLQTDENGLPDFVGEDDVVTTLSQNLHGLRTLSDMMKRLEELKDDVPWINEVIRMLDKNSDGYDKAAADVFFKTFRKSETLYTNIYKKKGKKKVFVLQPSNLGNKSKRMYNQAIKTILEGQYDTVLKKSGKNMSSVVVDENGLLDLEQYLEYLDDAIKGVDNNRRFDKKEAVNAILNLCDVLGFVIEDESNLNKLVIKGKGKEKISALGLYDIVKQFHSQLKGFVGKEMQLNDKRITDPYNKIANMLSVLSDQVVEKTTRDAQKTYQTYTESSPLQDLVDELRGDDIASQQDHDDYAEYGYSDGIFADQEHRFNRFRQFRRVQDGRNIYVSSWLRKLAYGENGSDKVLLRSLIRHFVHTSTDGKQYFKQNDDQYMLSLLLGYYLPSRTNMFDSYRKDMMLCRVPVISDKNSQEWILFEKEAVIADPSDPESIEEFKDAIVDASKEFFYFELQRMKSVLNHLRTGNPEDDIPNFHLKRDKAAALKSGKITRDMLMKDGKLADWVMKSGLSFRYFPMLNHEIENNTQFGKDVIALLNAKTEQEFEKRVTKMAGFREAFKKGMDDAFEVFKENLSEPVKKNLLNSVENMTKDELDTSLLEYFYNDFIATANILNLTLADPAFFKDTIDLQKRFAQYHSQTLKINTEAEFQFEGMDEPKRFSDGKFRFVTIKTLKQDSPLIDVTRKMFERLANEELKQNGDTAKYRELVLMRDTVPNFFKNVDVTDGQAYHSITSMWKKLNMLGASSEDIERFYKAVKGLGEGDISIRNINVVLQSMKPVVTGFVERGYDSKISSQDGKLLVPTYIKDSESLIFLAGAILHGANENHVLSDLYEFMELSHFNGELTFENYNSQGVDTICFDSAVKNGGGYVVDLNDCLKPGDALKKLNDLCYSKGLYTKWVQSMPYEGWGIQLNVPEHMQDHSQDLGSQDKILAVSDLPEDLGNMKVWQIDQLGKRTVQQDYSDRKQFLKDYFNLIDKEFKIGFKELDELFGIRFNDGVLTVDKDVFNQAISNMATENVIKDARYSIELFKAVAFLDANKDFITTIGDPLIADTIFGTVFTKIKNYVNKQKVPGGPVVQMSPFGLNDNLHIKDSDGNIMGSKKFDERNGLVYECYITAPTIEIERKITYSSDSKKMKKMKFSRTYQDGDILDMKDIIDNNILTNEDLEFIAYRIPTEDKYSIYRMEIKGFLSRKSGEIIIMPQDLTALSGTDFDIDKMYCWFKATSDDLYHPISERDMIHNQMFEMQWAALGHPVSVQHQLNPGNYLLLQDIANEVDVPSGEDDSLMYSHNQVKIKKANAAGKNYVGIAALNNTCHGISNMIDVRFKTMFDFNIDGVTRDMVMQQDESGNSFFQVDPIYSAFDGSRISKTLSMFVGAAADNAKQMLLGRLNTNPTTANIVMGMIRMGIPIRTVCYMMKTPIVQELIDEAESKGKFFEEVIMADKTSRIDDSNAMSFKIEGSEGGNMYRYIHGTISEREKKSLEKAIITFLKNMVSYSRNISDLNTLLSLNSTKNAVGPTIYDTISKWFKISMFPDNVSLNKTAFDNNLWDRIRENAPFIKTLYDTYNEYAIGICKQISPVCNDEFTQQILPILRSYDSQSDILSEDNLKKLINAYMLYRASKLGVVKTDEASRRELLYEFPIKFLKEQYRFGDNAFLSALEVTEKMNRSNKIPNIKLDMSRTTKDVVDLLQASWSQLVSMTPGSESASEMKNLSDMLLTYFSARFGYMWQPNSALNAAPNDAKNKFEGYSLIFDAGATPDWSDVDAVNVIQQFARNNPDCGLFYNIDDVKERSVNKKKKYYVKYSDWSESRFGFKVKNQLFLSNPFASPVTIENEEYIEVKPITRLGIDKNFMEYDASKMGSDIKTVVSQEETEKATKEYNEYVDLLNLQQQGESEEFQDQEDDDYDDEDTGTTPTYDSSIESNPVEGAALSETEEQVAKEILDLIKQNDLSVAFEEYNSVLSILNSREDFYDKVNDLLADESYSEKEKVLVEINNKIADIC